VGQSGGQQIFLVVVGGDDHDIDMIVAKVMQWPDRHT
jgi:hypothetical protein